MSKTDTNNDHHLLLLIARRDTVAFQKLYEIYHAKVFQYAFTILRKKDMAEDVLQDVFLKIWQLETKLIYIENLDGWLRIITRNHSINQLRKYAKETTNITLQEEMLISPHDELEKEMIKKEMLHFFGQALENLSNQQREVYRLCYENDFSYEEAAAVLNISSNTVHTHLKRALKSIREYMKNNKDLFILAFLMHLM